MVDNHRAEEHWSSLKTDLFTIPMMLKFCTGWLDHYNTGHIRESYQTLEAALDKNPSPLPRNFLNMLGNGKRPECAGFD